jgi:hypothetical protein
VDFESLTDSIPIVKPECTDCPLLCKLGAQIIDASRQLDMEHRIGVTLMEHGESMADDFIRLFKEIVPEDLQDSLDVNLADAEEMAQFFRQHQGQNIESIAKKRDRDSAEHAELQSKCEGTLRGVATDWNIGGKVVEVVLSGSPAAISPDPEHYVHIDAHIRNRRTGQV